MSTISGSDKLWYGFRVREFITYFTKKYGKPEVVLENGSYDMSKTLRAGRWPGHPSWAEALLRLRFPFPAWSNATGHVDLWDWNLCLGDFCQMKYRLSCTSVPTFS